MANTKQSNQLISESELQNLILDYLNRIPDFFAWRNNSTGVYDPTKKIFRAKGGFNIKGVSDILGVFKPSGKIIAIEVKKPGSTISSVSDEQTVFITKINSMGGHAIWAQSLEDVKSFISSIKC